MENSKNFNKTYLIMQNIEGFDKKSKILRGGGTLKNKDGVIPLRSLFLPTKIFILSKMYEIFGRKHSVPILNRFILVCLRLSSSDSSLMKPKTNLKDFVENDFSRVRKMPFKKNFVENLFVNKFEAKALEYPQLDTIEEVERLEKYCVAAQKLIMSEKASENVAENDTENAICEVDPKKAVATLKKYQFTGFQIPRIKSGFGFLSSEYLYMQEALGSDPSLVKTVTENEDYGIQMIDLFGSDEQKSQYLKKLIDGASISSFAHLESGSLIPFEENPLNTTAVLSSDNLSYTISGTKNWVYNANSADVFILSATIKGSDKEESPKPTLFLVNSNLPGVEIQKPIETLGMKKLTVCDVTFNNVVVPSSCILGNISEGGEIIKKVLAKGKLNIGGQCLAIMKKIVNESIKHCINNEFFNQNKYEMDYYRIKIGQMIAKIYVLESMTYLLTGRLDSFTNSETYLESIIVKVFSSEALQFVIKEGMEILGNEFITSDKNLKEVIKDSQFFLACDATNDHLRLVLSSAGIKHAMSYKASFYENVKKILHSLNFSSWAFSRNDRVEHKDELYGYLHLMFYKECFMLEDSVDILSRCTKYLIKTFGENVFHKYVELIHLADVAIHVYAMAATLARASRAYCLGFRFQEIDRISAEIEVKKMGLYNRHILKVFTKLNAFSSFPQISSSIMSSNNYSNHYPVIKNLKIEKRKHLRDL